MKKKTSVSIEEAVLLVIKREAKKQDRSVSYILEKFIEEKARELEPGAGKIVRLPSEKTMGRARRKKLSG